VKRRVTKVAPTYQRDSDLSSTLGEIMWIIFCACTIGQRYPAFWPGAGRY